jgi:AraC-like DNA-binding protein/uncharacterized RmlC-like cupin family protein
MFSRLFSPLEKYYTLCYNQYSNHYRHIKGVFQSIIMQKRASFKHLQAAFEPISFSEESLCYTDLTPVYLPDRQIQKLHFHNCIEIGICLSGSGIFLINDRVESVCAGDFIYVPPASHHYSQRISQESCVCAFVYVRQDLLQARLRVSGISFQELINLHATPQILHGSDATELTALTSRLLRSTQQKNEPLCALQIAQKLMELPHVDEAPTRAHRTDPVSIAAAYMAANYREKLSAAKLAVACHLSESQLRRRFCKIYGEAPHAYLNHLRCRIGAQMLLHTDRTVEDISEAVGYSCSSEFFRHFKSTFALSPTAWRKANRGGLS